jgi:hypothetical protein
MSMENEMKKEEEKTKKEIGQNLKESVPIK